MVHVSTSLLGEALVQTDFTVSVKVLGEGFSLSWQYLERASPTRDLVVFKSRCVLTHGKLIGALDTTLNRKGS